MVHLVINMIYARWFSSNYFWYLHILQRRSDCQPRNPFLSVLSPLPSFERRLESLACTMKIKDRSQVSTFSKAYKRTFESQICCVLYAGNYGLIYLFKASVLYMIISCIHACVKQGLHVIHIHQLGFQKEHLMARTYKDMPSVALVTSLGAKNVLCKLICPISKKQKGTS